VRFSKRDDRIDPHRRQPTSLPNDRDGYWMPMGPSAKYATMRMSSIAAATSVGEEAAA
jgi:hypothetical protein